MIEPQHLAIALALLSAVTVAAANFGVKRGGDVLVGRMVLSVSSALIVLPAAFFVPVPPLHLWPAVIGAVATHWLYQLGLIRALHRGDLSLVFPVMRGLSPMIVAVLAFVFLNESLKPLGWIGLALASLAVIAFARPGGDITTDGERIKRRLDRTALFYAGLTAIGIGLYTVVDAGVIRAMPSPYSFIVYLFLLDWIGITAVTLITRRGTVLASVRPQLKSGTLSGLASVISFGAALYALTLTEAALVTALRETSVVWAAIMGALWLKEGFGPRRIAAAGVLATGLILMQVFG